MRITEYGRRLLERDPVLGAVDHGLPRVPLEHGSVYTKVWASVRGGSPYARNYARDGPPQARNHLSRLETSSAGVAVAPRLVQPFGVGARIFPEM